MVLIFSLIVVVVGVGLVLSHIFSMRRIGGKAKSIFKK